MSYRLRRTALLLIIASCLIPALALSVIAGDRVLAGKKVTEPPSDEPTVRHKCLTCEFGLPVNDPVNGARDRVEGKRWALPSSQAADTTIHCLVLRFNFQYEDPDDPNTTGRGVMNVNAPLLDSVEAAMYYDTAGHLIDPPPHDSAYFHAHMRALNEFWMHASKGILDLTWDVCPTGATSTYTLPNPMSTYGACSNNVSDIIAGLEQYFVDCIQLADTAHLIDPGLYPDIDFANYDAVFLFHAGSDRQNDIGFPETCSDLFTGFIKFGDSVAVDGGAEFVRTALMMPETAAQDGRATALNAVMAHEFGHQLGLVDLYSTTNFMTQLGDFALMDNNGFGTGIDFGFDVGNVFGAVPVMPSAWSRAYLGFDPVLDIRDGDDVRIVAAAVTSDAQKIVRVPISEKEYYLFENRIDDIYPDAGDIQPIRLDSASNVILGPIRVVVNGTDSTLEFSGEYDALMPGNGMLVYHVDEEVAGLDYNGNGVNNFDDNQLQLNPDQRFIRIVEADGLVNFGGFYRAGFGSSDEMFREDRQSSFTPNTNPPAFDNTGNNTHVYVTNIHREKYYNPVTGDSVAMDSVMVFDVETDKLADGFPVRLKQPRFPFNPVVADIDEDGESDVIAVSDNRVFAFTPSGENLIHKISGCVGAGCTYYGDSSGSTVNPGVPYIVPLYAETPGPITAGPVVGSFGGQQSVVVGYQDGGNGAVAIYWPIDAASNGQADLATLPFTPTGVPIAMSLGTSLHVLVDNGVLWSYPTLDDNDKSGEIVAGDEYEGLCLWDDEPYVLVYDSTAGTILYHVIASGVEADTIDGYYPLGPIVGDFDRNGQAEIIVASRDGDLVTIGIGNGFPGSSMIETAATDFRFTTNPVAGDINGDGYAEIVFGGVNEIHAFNYRSGMTPPFTTVTGYPIEANDKFPDDDVVSPPIIANYASDGAPEIAFPTLVGNIYSFGPEPTFGFPVSAGERGAGSPVYYTDATGGYVGYLGADGWFYSWEVEADSSEAFWPMGGADASGSFSFDSTRLAPAAALTGGFDESRFYNYPNPVVDGRTTFRYYLSEAANGVRLKVYDLSGREVASFDGPYDAGVDVEIDWECADITPGVYRCMIEVEYVSGTEHAFTDVAIIR